MSTTTGAPRWPGATTFPGSAEYPGQGYEPIQQTLICYDDLDTVQPTWVDVTPDVLRFGAGHGRESDLAQMDAGSATVELDNRDRSYDPTLHSYIRPLNQLWLREQFVGETNDLFKGYVESYDQTWPEGFDAVAIVQAADEFKPLALDALPSMNPPSDSYEALITSENPQGYWKMDDTGTIQGAKATVGQDMVKYNIGTFSAQTPSPIVGSGESYLRHVGPVYLKSELGVGGAGDPSSAFEYTVEGWFKFNSWPSGTSFVILGPTLGGVFFSYDLELTTAGVLNFVAGNSAGTTFTVSSAALTQDVWYHVVATITSSVLRLYVNGVQVATTAWSGQFKDATPDFLWFANQGLVGNYDGSFSNIALYRYGLSAAQILNHYTAGISRGYAQQAVVRRIPAILDDVSSHAPRAIENWSERDVTATFMHGQDPLSEIRNAISAENVDAVFFASKSGALTYLSATHRDHFPWNTVQATFGDAAGELPFADLDVDYSDSFLTNEWQVTGTDGLTQTASDSGSITAYGKRSQALSGLPLVNDGDALNIANGLLGKNRNPELRVLKITLDGSLPEIAEVAYGLEVGDRIRLLRTPPGGGARIDETLFIQKIETSGAGAGEPWMISFAVTGLPSGPFEEIRATPSITDFADLETAYATFGALP